MSGRTKVIMMIAFALTLGAGAAVGMLGARQAAVRDQDKRQPPRSWLADELALNDEQREKMKTIWSDVSKSREESFDNRRKLDKERADAFQAFLGKLSPEQRAEYESIRQDFEQKRQALDRDREAKFAEAEHKTEEILTPEQRDKYKALRERRREGRGPDGHGPGGPGGGPPDGSGRRGRGRGGPGGPGGGPPMELPPTQPASQAAP